jgi:uncharacterized protein YbjT (DUF2867 family)
MKIAIGTATGNIGSRVAAQIAKAEIEMVLLGRDEKKLNALHIPNATTVAVDITDTKALIKATQGVDALLWLVPPVIHYSNLKKWYNDVAMAGVAAVVANNIQRVVLISSIGAGAADNLGTVSYAGLLEAAFQQRTANVVALRPGYFMENFLMQPIREKGKFYFTYSPEHDIPFISSDDIGDIATQYLLDDTWAGKWTRNLMGPANITMSEAAQLFSSALGRSVEYEQVSLENMNQQMISAGANVTVQQELRELFVALGDPDGIYATARTAEAFTSTSLEEFIQRKLIA